MWLMVLAGAFLGQSALGSHYASGTTLSGTPSAAAASLLQRAVPGQSGDTEQIVFQTKTGTVKAPAVQKQIQTMLGRVSQLRYVSGVTSPYTPPGAKQISAGKRVAFATVNFTKDANNISAAEATRLVKLAGRRTRRPCRSTSSARSPRRPTRPPRRAPSSASSPPWSSCSCSSAPCCLRCSRC